jgi:ATP-dependent RNA helicase RhlE
MNQPTFSSLGLIEPILSAVKAEGYEIPTPIQAATIPSVLAGHDLLGCAQTGTGKTAAFALPIIQRLHASAARPAPRGCRVLVVAPTRELAAQIDASFAAYGAGSRITRACIFGGVGKSPQVKAVGRGVDVLTATPGRLLDLHAQGQLRLDGVETVVLDEADRMLDMGFIRDVRKIMALLPAKRQTLLFSATMPSDIASLASSVLRDPIRVSVTPDHPTVDLIDQSVVYVDKTDKRAYLAALIQSQAATRAIVFTRTKHGADRLAKALESSGIAAAAIHANKSQNNRTRTLDSFRSGELRVLVATDLAARGIDVDSISHVYNYELPEVAETYVHRIGRTARAGAQGEAVALCDNEEKPLLRAIEKLLRTPVPLAQGPAFETARISAAADRASSPPPLVDRGERRQQPRRGKPVRTQNSSSSSRDMSRSPSRGTPRGTRSETRRDSRPASRAEPRRNSPQNPQRERSGELSRSAAGSHGNLGQGPIRV